jgi:hypothetical protein
MAKVKDQIAQLGMGTLVAGLKVAGKLGQKVTEKVKEAVDARKEERELAGQT